MFRNIISFPSPQSTLLCPVKFIPCATDVFDIFCQYNLNYTKAISEQSALSQYHMRVVTALFFSKCNFKTNKRGRIFYCNCEWLIFIRPMGMKSRGIGEEKCTDIVYELDSLGSINLDDKN